MTSPDEEPDEAAAWIETPERATHPLGGDCYFGRIEGNEIVVPDTRTSRRHAVIRRQGNRFVLVDLGSTNGTSLNGKRIFKPAVLRDHDVVGIGSLRYVFRDPSGRSDAGTQSPVPTTAAVGITNCWILVATVPDRVAPQLAEWIDGCANNAAASGARTSGPRGAILQVHWREELARPASVRSFVLETALKPLPAGIHVAVHHGPVRVGTSIATSEETLLGATVTFAHGLGALARDLGLPNLLSETALRTLGIGPEARSVGGHAIRGAKGEHPVYTVPVPGA